MSNDVTISFITYYIRSLAERTRVERSGTKFGFDWIIYNLALADDLVPCRLPFFRGEATQISRTKTEAELGIDFSFLSADRTKLIIFVLKDEELRNQTWTKCDFDSDLRKAAAPDLTPPEFRDVRGVTVILAYNKDEDQTGIQLFTNLTKSFGTRVGDEVLLSFERWNLTTISEKVRTRLLTPSLLPQKFFSLFSYICSQFGDFRHGSDEWTKQLIPNWRRFLDDLLEDDADERSARLLPVALIVVREYAQQNSTAKTGWLDLAEWAMLSLWRVHRRTSRSDVQTAVVYIWTSFYLIELDQFYSAHVDEISFEHSLETHRSGSFLDAIAASMIAHWHIGRLGVLALGGAELTKTEQRAHILRTIANRVVGLINANPASKRPLLDLHHIQLFLVWWMLWQLGRTDDFYHWLLDLCHRLMVRRAGIASLPFIEGRNSLDLVFEFVASGKKPPEFCERSSLYLLCVLELCFSLTPAQRDELAALFYRHLVLGRDSNGVQLQGSEPIDLVGWLPPTDWNPRVLSECMADDGECQVLDTFEANTASDGSAISAKVKGFVQQSRAVDKLELLDGLPVSVIVLACLKHGSPLPPELWRRAIFGPITTEPKR